VTSYNWTGPTVVTIGSERYPDGTAMPWPVSDEDVPAGWVYGPTPKAAVALYHEMVAAVDEVQSLLRGDDPVSG
jgi:hypothetical protein